MAEDEQKSEGGGLEGYWVIIIIVVVLMIGAASSGQGLLHLTAPESETPSNTIEDLEKSKEPLFSISKLIGQGDLELGGDVISVGETQVRRSPGGAILGLQKKLNAGRLMEGPVEQFGTTWWRVNFEEAPSGWVEFDTISTKSKIVKLVNLPSTVYQGYKPIGWILSVLLLLVLIFLRLKLSREDKITKKKMRVQDEQAEQTMRTTVDTARDDLGLPTGEEFKNQRWEHVLELMKSRSQGDWRSAIIEADIILDEMLRRMSYDGLTIGDMLKQVEESDFVTLQKAWEAHKFRNEIAHTGSEFRLSKDEADRVIALFQAVFNEFYYI